MGIWFSRLSVVWLSRPKSRLLQNSKLENLFKHQLSCIAAIKPAPNDYEGKHTKAMASAMAAPAEKRLLMLDNINENI
ncbi:hypothetical protein WN943_017252 [Citrus x changshan-huyou]